MRILFDEYPTGEDWIYPVFVWRKCSYAAYRKRQPAAVQEFLDWAKKGNLAEVASPTLHFYETTSGDVVHLNILTWLQIKRYLPPQKKTINEELRDFKEVFNLFRAAIERVLGAGAAKDDAAD